MLDSIECFLIPGEKSDPLLFTSWIFPIEGGIVVAVGKGFLYGLRWDVSRKFQRSGDWFRNLDVLRVISGQYFSPFFQPRPLAIKQSNSCLMVWRCFEGFLKVVRVGAVFLNVGQVNVRVKYSVVFSAEQGCGGRRIND